MRSHPGLLLASAAAAGLIPPRAVVGGVRADASASDLIRQFDAAFSDFRQRQDSRLKDIESALDGQAAILAAAKLGGGGGVFRAADPAYSEIFASFFRSGQGEDQVRHANAQGQRAQLNASMSEGSNTSGGYLAPTEWDRRVTQAQIATSPMRRLATVQTTGVNAYFTLWNDRSWGSGWVGETAARPSTSTPNLSQVNFAAGEIYANAAITQRLLDDADFDVTGWLSNEVTIEFNRQEGIAFISGDGVNKPFGLLQYVAGGAAATQHPGGTLGITPSGAAAALGANDAASAAALVDFTYALAAPYRQNATWLMNSQTAATIAKLKDGQGNFLWREAFQAGQPPILLGRPVEFDENMPSIAADALPIAYGDFRAGYLINDRIGMRVLRDPYTNKPFVQFYCTKRVGAGVQDPNAIRLLKIAVS